MIEYIISIYEEYYINYAAGFSIRESNNELLYKHTANPTNVTKSNYFEIVNNLTSMLCIAIQFLIK